MGIIRKQTIQNTLFSYIGIALGFIASGILLPQLLNTEQNGLLKILVAVSMLFAQFANLGFPNVIIRTFPFFRNPEKKHYGFLFYPLIVSLAGFLILCVIFLLFKDVVIAQNIEKSSLLINYIYWLLPLTLSFVLFNVLDAYSRATYNSVPGLIIKEFLQRILIILSLIAYSFQLISFHYLVILFVLSQCIPTILIALVIIKQGEWHWMPDFSFMNKALAKDMAKVSLLSIMASFSSNLISSIDSIMLNQMMGLSATGIYAITFYFGTIIIIPARSMYRISAPVIAESWKENNLENIKKVYEKSCINQLIIGLLLFLGIWGNINNFFHILPTEYEKGRYVILLISFANLIDMATGVNGLILITSKYYKYDTIFMLLLVIITILANYLLIPTMGINGAAMAALIAIFLYNLMRYLFIWIKLGMQPFDFRSIKAIVIGFAVYLLNLVIPEMNNYIFDIAIRSSIIGGTFMTLIYFFKVSEDINSRIDIYYSSYIKPFIIRK